MKIAGSVLIFIAMSVCAAVVLAFPCGGLSRGLAWMAFAVGLMAAVPAWRRIPPQTPCDPNVWEILLLTIFALVSLRAFLWLIYPVGDEWRILSPNNLGDISLHIQMIRYFAGGVDFWPASPILAGTPLTYPLGIDLFNGLLLCVGVPWDKGLLWVGLCGAALSGWALWRWGGAFAIAALIFNGGLSGFLFFQSGLAGDLQADLAWKNIFLSMFVTQRGFLYALPCGLFLLMAWREAFFQGTICVPRWITLLLYTTMPFFSVHTFIFLSLVLACAFLVCPSARKSLLLFVGAGFFPATAAMYFVTGKWSVTSGLRWLPGWMQGNEGWLFWIWNFGALLPLLFLLGYRMARTRQPVALCFAGTGIIVFFICCFVSFAPWEWDNTKLFLWAWLACAPFLWEMLTGWRPVLRVTACILLFFSGAVALIDGLSTRHGYLLIKRSELADAHATLQQVPMESRIAVTPEFNNPAILLGHPVLCGYEGHLWSHGLHYHKQWDALQLALKQKVGWQNALAALGVDGVFVQGPPSQVIPLNPLFSPK